MSGAKHTEGPWFVGLDYRNQERVFAGRFEVVRALSTVGVRRLKPEERAANRRLIAAAPELLEALKEARPHLAFAGPMLNNSPSIAKTIKAIDAAVAKAEGTEA